jgi:hypothetical protein
VAQAATVWKMTRQTAPDLYDSFMAIRRALTHAQAQQATERVYSMLRPVNFSTGVCERLPARLRVLPVPEVGWSDWGSVERIGDTLRRRQNEQYGAAGVRSHESIPAGRGAAPPFTGKPSVPTQARHSE